jgi:hypothetical protein
MMRQLRRLVIAALLGTGAPVLAGEAPGRQADLPVAARDVLARYPGTRIHREGGRPRIVYGARMAQGVTPRRAADAWLEAHSEVFGAGRLQLRERWETPVMDGRFTAFAYQQYLDGLPVEYGNVRLLVLNEPEFPVVYAAATVAPALGPDQGRPNLDGPTAVQIARAHPLFGNLPQWGEAELAVFQGAGDWIEPVVVWKVSAHDPTDAMPRGRTFFVDAATGRLVHVRNEVDSNDVNGTVRAWATPGTLPDTASNPPTLQDVAEMRVAIDGGASVYTSRDGLFMIEGAGGVPVDVGTGVGSAQGYGGLWVNVVPVSAAPLSQVLGVAPPGAAHFVLNPAPMEQLTAQVNAFIHTTLVHNYMKDRAPGFSGIDMPVRVNTGVSGSCNASFSYLSLQMNLYNASEWCPNTAYSSIIAHEYGHFIVNRLGVGQGGFGEGYGDVTAMLLYDDEIVGRDFTGPGGMVRHPVAANVQYPCPTNQGIHYCGQILGGVWWRMRENLGNAFGSGPGLDHARDLHVGWSLITVGGTGNNFRNSAHPATALEVLALDDDDGNLANGTPNWVAICAAFDAHSIGCPPLNLVEFQFPNGLPVLAPPNEPVEIAVNIVPVDGAPQPGTGHVVYRVSGGSPTIEPMMEVSPNQYIATLPGVDCGRFVEFYFTVLGNHGMTSRYPEYAPDEALAIRALAGAAETIVFDDDFATDQGWTVWSDGSLTQGAWERVIPNGSFYLGHPVQPGGAYRGQHCYVTENGAPGAPVSSHDVYGGPTILTSPRMDISSADVADLSFAYWHYTFNGQPDLLEVGISVDDGVNWTTIATYGNETTPRRGEWIPRRFDLLDYIDPTPDLRVRFSVSDNPNDSLTESAIDDFRVTIWRCPLECYANCDGSTIDPVLNVDDFICFIGAFAAAQGMPHEEQITHYANCDGSTIAPVLNVDDFTCFISAFASGCP